MSFWKKYPKSKDARKRMRVFHSSKDFDPSCHNHGSCPYCREQRTFNTTKRVAAAEDQTRDSHGRSL